MGGAEKRNGQRNVVAGEMWWRLGGAREWKALENGRRWRMRGAGDCEVPENFVLRPEKRRAKREIPAGQCGKAVDLRSRQKVWWS